MPTVFSSLRDAAGNPQGNIPVVIELKSDPPYDTPSPGFVGASDYDIVLPADLVTDEDGGWSVDLAANDDVTYPALSYYEVREGRKSFAPQKTYRITVPVGGGPYSVADILYEGTGIVGLAIQNEGTTLPARDTINFQGALVDVVDDAANNRTNVVVSTPTGLAPIQNFGWHYDCTLNGSLVRAEFGDSLAVRQAKAVHNNAQLEALAAYFGGGGGGVLYLGPGHWPLNDLEVLNSNLVIEGLSSYATFLDYYNIAGAGSTFLGFRGPADSFGGRIRRSGLRRVCLNFADGDDDCIALKILNGTHMTFEEVFWTGFRRSAIFASNFADTTFWEAEFEYCGSIDDSNSPVIDFNGSQTAWAVDQVKFPGARIEACGDRVLSCVNGNGHYVNKIFLTDGFKVESADQSGGTAEQFHLVNAGVVMDDFDITLQHLRSGHAKVPRMINMIGTCKLLMGNGQINLGGDASQHYDYAIRVEQGTSKLGMVNVLVDSENNANHLNNVVQALNTPSVSAIGCEYSGGSPMTTSWITGATNAWEMP